jgi:hypothetical protein
MPGDKDGSLSEHEQQLFDKIERALAEDPRLARAFKDKRSWADRWQDLKEFFGNTVTPRRTRIALLCGLMLVAGALTREIFNVYQDDEERAKTANAKLAAMLTVLDSPELRAQIGVCDAELGLEKQAMVFDGHPAITMGQINQALSRPGSSEVPCQPLSLDGVFTMEVDGMTVNITALDILSHSLANLPNSSPSAPVPQHG